MPRKSRIEEFKRGNSSFITINGTNSFALNSDISKFQANAPSLGTNESQITFFNFNTEIIEAVINAVISTNHSSVSYLLYCD